jgi:DNA-binding FadR family transcriptional regulator
MQIAAISGNPIFVSVSEAMLGWLKAYHVELLFWSGKETFTLGEHEQIIAAIEKGDADAAEEALVIHLKRSAILYALSNQKEQA